MSSNKIKEKYSIGAKIGSGGFAVVRRCKRRSDEAFFAIKVIGKKNLDEHDLQAIKLEVKIMEDLSHPNIVNLHDVFNSRSKLCLVLDLLVGGELFDRIIEVGKFSEKDAASCFSQVTAALAYLHSKSIVHRDLKPENLLFATKGRDSVVKIIDFGLAASCKDGQLKTPCGTPNYVAPEIIEKHAYGPAVDMWSIGVILYIILCGFPPFYDRDDNLMNLYMKIASAEYSMPAPYWNKISIEAKDLVRKLLIVDPKKRLTASEALQHEWLKGNVSDKALGAEHAFHLKRFQYIRRLRRGVRCILAVLRLVEALQDNI